jgi:hypothetical protein
VESTLRYHGGFYGLIASGWDVEDTTGKGKRGALPGEAIEVEFLVGLLDKENASGSVWTADEVNEAAALYASSAGRPAPRPVSDSDLDTIRQIRGELFSGWFALRPGQSLELHFRIP